jgi:hypothetical protein
MRRATAVLLAFAAAGAIAPAADAAKSCGRIANPYPDSRYEGVDIKRIRATGVTCGTARRVARRAHRKALGLTPPPVRLDEEAIDRGVVGLVGKVRAEHGPFQSRGGVV